VKFFNCRDYDGKYSTHFMFYDIKQVIQATNPSDVNEVELNQNETVAHETENLLVASDEKSAELENTTEELTEQKEISIEPNNIRGRSLCCRILRV
jgi:hypothetical protein